MYPRVSARVSALRFQVRVSFPKLTPPFLKGPFESQDTMEMTSGVRAQSVGFKI